MNLPPTTPTLNVFISCLPVAPYRTQLTEQIQAYGQQCRAAALEEAATICDSLGGDINYNNPDETRLCANSLAHAIRSLKS